MDNPTYEEYSKKNEEFLKKHPGDVQVTVTEETLYLMRQQWLLGYTACMIDNMKDSFN